MQLTSATTARVSEMPWKKLLMLPGQTVLQTARLKFPAVRAETRFFVQCLDAGGNVLGATEVIVYPTNLLVELRKMVGHGDGAIGVYDPENQFKPLLQKAGVDFVDLENAVLEEFRGKLAIIGPFDFNARAASIVPAQIKVLSKNGVAVVWVQHPRQGNNRSDEEPEPSFYSVPQNRVATVVVQPGMVAGLASDPRSQLNLIYFCKLALAPEPLTLPFLK